MSAHPEWDLIADLRQRAGAHPRVPIGIGDDAALVDSVAGGTVVTTDLLMDGVDFIVGETPTTLIGRKSLAVSLSDIAAMAARPVAAIVSLALPCRGGRELADALYDGLLSLAREFDVCLAGGDTNAWDGPLVVNVTLLGEPTSRGVVRRAGARPGDTVFVTGKLGGSLPSLRHCTFIPRVREALALHEAVELHAMIDLSDGLATDLGHLAGASGVGMVIDASAIPIHDDVAVERPRPERLRHALTDGEDFELAFCVSASEGARLASTALPGIQLFQIGRCTQNLGVGLDDQGHLQPLGPEGWEHRFD